MVKYGKEADNCNISCLFIEGKVYEVTKFHDLNNLLIDN